MVSAFTELIVDCLDPGLLSRFWCAALGYRVVDLDEEDGAVEIAAWTPEQVADVHPHLRPPTIVFVPVPEPKTVKDRLHIDLNTVDDTQEHEVERLLALGATRTDVGQGEVSWVVLADPEGNEFCVLAGTRTSPGT